MKRWRGLVPIVLLFIVICLTLREFIVRDLGATKIFPAIYFILFILLFIGAVKDFLKKHTDG